jgi:hypothetical protein
MAAATDSSNAAMSQQPGRPLLESIELTVINVPPSTAATTAGGGGASLTIGHQMSNGSYKVLHTILPSTTTTNTPPAAAAAAAAAAAPATTASSSGSLGGYYTLVPNRSKEGGDFKTATAYRSGVARDGATTVLTMTRMDLA